MLLKSFPRWHTKCLAEIMVGVHKTMIHFLPPGDIQSSYFPVFLEVKLVIWSVGCKQKHWVSLLGWDNENPWVAFQLSFLLWNLSLEGTCWETWWIKKVQAKWILESPLRQCLERHWSHRPVGVRNNTLFVKPLR